MARGKRLEPGSSADMRAAEEWRHSPMPELHRTVTAVADQLHAVRRTLRWDQSPGETGAALIALGPMLTELGEALAGWNHRQDRRNRSIE